MAGSDIRTYLLMKLKDPGLGISRETNSSDSEPLALERHRPGRLDAVRVGQEGGGVSAKHEVAVVDRRTAGQLGALHVIALQEQGRTRRANHHLLPIFRGHGEVRAGELQRTPVTGV